jgi:hypothetical protein
MARVRTRAHRSTGEHREPHGLAQGVRDEPSPQGCRQRDPARRRTIAIPQRHPLDDAEQEEARDRAGHAQQVLRRAKAGDLEGQRTDVDTAQLTSHGPYGRPCKRQPHD